MVDIELQHRGDEGLHLPGVVAAAYTENDSAVSQDVCGGDVIGRTQWVPHRKSVEGAAER